MLERARAIIERIDAHATKLLGLVGAGIAFFPEDAVYRVTGYEIQLRELVGDTWYHRILGVAFLLVLARGVVCGRRFTEMKAIAMRPPEIP